MAGETCQRWVCDAIGKGVLISADWSRNEIVVWPPNDDGPSVNTWTYVESIADFAEAP